MAKALVVYTTRTGNTKAIAESIGNGLRETGADVKLFDANDVTGESDIAGFDAYLFGSPTYRGEMMHEMKNLLLIAARANLKGKTGGAFGAYGWSGEAPMKIYETMEYSYGMEMVDKALRIQVPVASKNLRQSSEAFGREVGQKIPFQDSKKIST